MKKSQTCGLIKVKVVHSLEWNKIVTSSSRRLMRCVVNFHFFHAEQLLKEFINSAQERTSKKSALQKEVKLQT